MINSSVRDSLKDIGNTKTGRNMAALPERSLPPAPDPALDPAGYLKSIHAIRERSRLVLDKAKANQLAHFDLDPLKFSETAAYVVSIIKVSSLIGRPGEKKLFHVTSRMVRNTLHTGKLIVINSATTVLITPRYRLMADGNTSRWVVDLELISCWLPGHPQSTLSSGLDDCSTSSLSPSFSMPEPEPIGSTGANNPDDTIGEAKGSLLLAWRCSLLGYSVATLRRSVKWTPMD